MTRSTLRVHSRNNPGVRDLMHARPAVKEPTTTSVWGLTVLMDRHATTISAQQGGQGPWVDCRRSDAFMLNLAVSGCEGVWLSSSNI